MATNNTADVTNSKGVQGGYAYCAAVGSTYDTGSNPFAELGTAFDNLGFISSDGIEEELDTDSDNVTDLSGDVVYVVKASTTETLTFTLMSVTEASLKEWYGHDNVEVESTYIEVDHTVKEHENKCYLFDLVLKDGRRWRKVVPNGIVSEVGSITYASGEVTSREITVTCMPDATGVRMYDYIETATTTTTGE